MDVQEIRIINLRRLANDVGGMKALGDILGKAKAQMTHLAGPNPVRAISKKFAQHVEETFNKPEGWMDQPHWMQGKKVHVTNIRRDRVVPQAYNPVPIPIQRVDYDRDIPDLEDTRAESVLPQQMLPADTSPMTAAIIVPENFKSDRDYIKEKDLVFVDPEKRVFPGDFVVVWLDLGEPTLAECRVRRTTYEPESNALIADLQVDDTEFSNIQEANIVGSTIAILHIER